MEERFELSELLRNVHWTEMATDTDTLYSINLADDGRITVLDRLTGFSGGIRDIESGYKDRDGRFWLASGPFDIDSNGQFTITSGQFDIRAFPNLTIEQAVELIKENATLEKDR